MNRQWILGYPVDLETTEVILQRFEETIQRNERLRIVTINPEMVMAARKNHALANAIQEAHFVVPDGVGVVLALRRRGIGAERIAGVDLAEVMMERLASLGGRIFLLGGRPNVAQQAGIRLAERFPGLVIAGVAHGYFNEENEDRLLEAIDNAQPHLLLVGMGLPWQEVWLSSRWERLQALVGMGIGGGLDLWSGATRRAPRWMQMMGLEWLYRLVREPWRLRRLGVIPEFLVRMLLERGVETDHV